MNKTLIIGIVVIVIIGIGAVLLTNDPAPVVVENDPAPVEDMVTEEMDTSVPTDETEVVTPEPQSIVDIALATPDLSTLTGAVEAAGLIGTLSAEGPFTVLAPNDSAFAAVPEETLTALTDPANIEDLQAVLGLHVISGITTSADLEDGMTVTTLAGEELTVSIEADGSVTIGGATVISADVMADNGVVHIIDTVITDPA